MLQLKSVRLEKTNQNICFNENGYVRKQGNSFQELAMIKNMLKNNLISQKEKPVLASSMELNSEKASWDFIQDLCSKEKTKTRIQSLLNCFGNKITKPKEFENLLKYRFNDLREFISLQPTNNLPPKTAPRKCFRFKYITTKEKNVLIDSLHTCKPVGPSKIPAWAIKDAKAVLAQHYVFSFISSLQRENFQKILKKLV